MKKNFAILILMSVIAGNINAQNYNKLMKKIITETLGRDFLRPYELISYPTNNFGLGSCYEYKVSDTSLVCDAYFCMTGKKEQPASGDFIGVLGLAAVGENGAVITATNDQKSSFSFDFLLPSIFNAIGVSAGGKYNKNSSYSLNLGPIVPRQIRGGIIDDSLIAKSPVKGVRTVQDQNNLVIIAADLVISSLSFSLKISKNDSTAISAKMVGTGNSSVAEKIFSGASLNLKVQKSEDGTFTFIIDKPVILARIGKAYPKSSGQSAIQDWKTWKTVHLKDNNKLVKKYKG